MGESKISNDKLQYVIGGLISLVIGIAYVSLSPDRVEPGSTNDQQEMTIEPSVKSTSTHVLSSTPSNDETVDGVDSAISEPPQSTPEPLLLAPEESPVILISGD